MSIRKEIEYPGGRTLVFEDCGPRQFVISMLHPYKGEPPRDERTGRKVFWSVCLTGRAMVDVLNEAVTSWYREAGEKQP